MYYGKNLLGSHEHAAEHQEGCCPFVEKLESPIVDGDGVDFQEAACDLGDSSHEFCHGSTPSNHHLVTTLTNDVETQNINKKCSKGGPKGQKDSSKSRKRC